MLYCVRSVSKMPNWPVLVHPIGQKMRSKFCHQIHSSIFLTIFFKTNIHVSAFECNRINRVRLLYSEQCCSNTSVCSAIEVRCNAQCVLCTVYLPRNQTSWDRKICISIYLLTYVCPRSFVRGEYIFVNFCEIQTLNFFPKRHTIYVNVPQCLTL